MSTQSSVRQRPTYKTCKEVSAICPVIATTYGYYPNFGGNIFFTILFGICAILSVAFGVKSRTWTYTAALFSGTVLECLGYVGRVMMHDNPWSGDAFKLQICCLVLAPSFLAACIYLTLKHLVLFFGPEHSILKPRLYPWIFIGCDIGSICLQALGGGVASAATNNPNLLKTGNGLIVAGISFQVATMAVCGLLCLIYYIRYQKAKKSASGSTASSSPGAEKSNYHHISEDPQERRKLVIFCFAIALAYLAILVRCIYRFVDLLLEFVMQY